MLKNFFGFIEIKTKVTSVMAFIYALAYLFYLGEQIDIKKTMVFFFAMLLFDMTTTAINNYIGADSKENEFHFGRVVSLVIIFSLLTISIALGIYLFYLTDVVVLILGVMCFVCGILYTYSPLAISKQPWGELLSGVFYGFFIPFILIYMIRDTGTYLDLDLNLSTISLKLQVFPLISIFVFSIIPTFATSNIMLANNICDLKKDAIVKRYTLPYYIGKKNAINLFALLYMAIYVDLLILCMISVLHPVCLIGMITILPVLKNVSVFRKYQSKDVTFDLSVKNYLIIMSTISVLIIVSRWIDLVN